MVSWLTKNPLVRTQEKWIGANRICERNDRKNLTLEEKEQEQHFLGECFQWHTPGSNLDRVFRANPNELEYTLFSLHHQDYFFQLSSLVVSAHQSLLVLFF